MQFTLEAVAAALEAAGVLVERRGALPRDASSITDDSRSVTRGSLFVALRGRTPLSGDPHNATGATPGLGILRVNADGRGGELIAIVPIENTVNPGATDPHGLRVRLLK